MGNLLLRCFTLQVAEKRGSQTVLTTPGSYITYQWDASGMRITNFEPANQFLKRTYRKGWGNMAL